MADDLTIDEILRRVVEAGRSITSLEMAAVRVTDKQGERTEGKSRAVRVGDDGYEWSDDDRGRHHHREELNYRGREYFRDDRDGEWRIAEAWGQAVSEVEIEAQPGTTWNEKLVSEAYGMDFNTVLGASRLADEAIEGRRMVRLSATTTLPTMIPSLEDLERHLPSGASIPSEVRQRMQEKLTQEPDSLSLKHDLWIDADRWHLVKMVLEGTAHRRGDVSETFVETRSFSKFNEAELPRPLPYE